MLEEGEEAAGTTDGKLQAAEIDRTYILGQDVIAQAVAAPS